MPFVGGQEESAGDMRWGCSSTRKFHKREDSLTRQRELVIMLTSSVGVPMFELRRGHALRTYQHRSADL